jgi:hypothetical protein
MLEEYPIQDRDNLALDQIGVRWRGMNRSVRRSDRRRVQANDPGDLDRDLD